MAHDHPNVTVSDHQLIKHFLTLMRPKECSQNLYRQCLSHIYTCLAVEALRDFELPRSEVDLTTPSEDTAFNQPFIHTEEILIAAILRGGMAPAGVLSMLFPLAPIAHFGIEGGKDKGPIRVGYKRIPEDVTLSKCLLIAPRIETGGSVMRVVEELKRINAPSGRDMIVLNIVCAPQGAEGLLKAFPDMKIMTASVEEGLNKKNQIIPGIGHTGERIYGPQDSGV